MSMGTSTSGGQGDDDMKVKNVSEIINCSLDLARELLAICGGDVNKVIDNFFCGSGSRSFKKNEADVDAAKIPAQESIVTSGGISSVMKRKRPPIETIITIDDSDDDENPDDEDPPEKKKFKKLREDLSDYLVKVRKAKYMSKGEEEEDRMTLEDCPKCSAPQILPDKAVSLYHCPECGAVICRKCLQQAHGDKECEGGKEDEVVKEDEVEYKKITVLPSRNFDMDNEFDREFRIAEGQFLRMAGTKRKCYEIKSIDVVYNKKLKDKFNEKKLDFQRRGLDDKPLLIFHGTPQENIEPILRDNFDLTKVANGRKFGNGVYFSEMPEVSLGYSRDQSSLILCLVLQGDNTKEVSSTGVQAVDSAWAVIVPDVDQILPKYVINFVDKPKDKRNKNVLPSGLHQFLFNAGTLHHHARRPVHINLGTGASGSAQHPNLVSNLYNQHLLHSGSPVLNQGTPAQATWSLPGQASAGIAPGAAQNVQPVPAPQNITYYCNTCLVEFNSEDTMKSHMQGVRHMQKQLALGRMLNLGQPVDLGQTSYPSSQDLAHQAATYVPPNQHMHNCPWVHTQAPGYTSPAVSTLSEQLMQIVSQGTRMQQMPTPQMMPVPPPIPFQTQNRNVDFMSRRCWRPVHEADASKTASSSLFTFKNQEPKFQKVKLIVEDDDSSGIAVPGSRVDLANCRELYCALCDVWLASKEMMEAHMKDEKHGKKEKEVKK